MQYLGATYLNNTYLPGEDHHQQHAHRSVVCRAWVCRSVRIYQIISVVFVTIYSNFPVDHKFRSLCSNMFVCDLHARFFQSNTQRPVIT